jgi:hypothetical protein
VRKAAALRLALLVTPALERLYTLMKQNEHPAVALAAVREVLERNGLDASGKPGPLCETPTVSQTFNVSQVKFGELSDEGLNLVGQVLKAIKSNQPPMIDVAISREPVKAPRG